MRSSTLNHLGIASLVIAALSVSHASAANIAWWRMGDSGDAPAVDGLTGNDIGGSVFFGAGSGIHDEYGGDNDLFRGGETVDVRYSDDVPGPQIYDPLSDTTVDNEWSAYSGVAGNRPQANNSTPMPSAVSVETFMKHAALSDGSSGVDVIYQLSNSSGGFRFQSFADGSLRLQIKEEDNGGDGPYTSFSSAAGVIEAGEWHHLALVMAPDDSGNDDIFVYVDGAAVISGNYTNDDELPASGFPFLIGETFSGDGSEVIPLRFDETRYFSHAIGPNDFLQVVPEPGSAILIGIGALGLLGWRRSTKR